MPALTQSQQQALVAGMAQTTTECCCAAGTCDGCFELDRALSRLKNPIIEDLTRNYLYGYALNLFTDYARPFPYSGAGYSAGVSRQSFRVCVPEVPVYNYDVTVVGELTGIRFGVHLSLTGLALAEAFNGDANLYPDWMTYICNLGMAFTCGGDGKPLVVFVGNNYTTTLGTSNDSCNVDANFDGYANFDRVFIDDTGKYTGPGGVVTLFSCDPFVVEFECNPGFAVPGDPCYYKFRIYDTPAPM